MIKWDDVGRELSTLTALFTYLINVSQDRPSYTEDADKPPDLSDLTQWGFISWLCYMSNMGCFSWSVTQGPGW